MSNIHSRVNLVKKSSDWWTKESEKLMILLKMEQDEKEKIKIEKKLAFLYQRGIFELRVMDNLIKEIDNE